MREEIVESSGNIDFRGFPPLWTLMAEQKNGGTNMRYPSFLQEQGTIGFVAPSFGCAEPPYKTAFLHAQEKLAESGYKLELGPNCYAREGIGISNTPEKCGEELNDFLCSDKSDVLISCGGGELMGEVLDYVDFDRIFAVSDETAGVFAGVYPECQQKLSVFHNLIDTEAIRQKALSPVEKSMHEGIRLLTVGRLTPQKGFDCAVYALKLLLEKQYPVYWYIIGEGPEYGRLTQLARSLHVEDHFIFLGMQTNPERLYENNHESKISR